MSSTNPTFSQLRRQYPFEIPALAQRAGVGNRIVYAMLRGLPVKRSEAKKVLAGLSNLINNGWDFTLDMVDVVLEEEDEGQTNQRTAY